MKILRFTIYDSRLSTRTRDLALMLLVTFLVPWAASPLVAAGASDEQALIQVLQSNASLAEKDAACARLKLIGTARSVPALAALLPDEQLSHSARYALEPMHLAEAGRALIDALPKTTGLIKAGIINSLGVRGETQAVPALTNLLSGQGRGASAVRVGGSDAAIVAAAATALGQIGGAAALQALESAAKDSTGPVHDAEVDALLRCANRLLAAGSRSEARAVFEGLHDHEKNVAVRIAAYRGLIRASGDGGVDLMTRAIAGEPGPERTAALQLVHDVEASGATAALVKLLPKAEPPVQVALVEGLSQRNDPAALPAIRALATSTVPAVRLAVINTLGILGDASSIPLLAGFAESATGEEQKAARQSLAQLRGGKITESLIAQLATANPAMQAELARALGERGDKTAVPKLLDLAHTAPDSARKGALQALAMLVEEPQLASLVQVVLGAQDEPARAQAAEALNSACQRLQAKHGRLEAEALAKGLEAGSPDARVALLPVCSGLVAPPLRVALRASLQDPDPRVRAAAIRALCDTVDTDFLPDLVAASHGALDEKLRALAVAGCVRLATQGETPKLSNSQRIDALRGLLARPLRPDQTRLVLAGLGEVPDPQALKLVEPLLEDAEVKTEAARAAIKITAALPATESPTSIAILKKALAAAADDSTRQVVQTALHNLEANADYLTAWQVAGPYRQTGKDYSALFDIAFPPELANAERSAPAPGEHEKPAAASDRGAPNSAPPAVVWNTLPPGADPKRPWVMDLLKPLGGEQCVAYARTWIESNQEQPARLEIGSDDGVKVWLNEKLVHAHNVARALQPGADKVEVTLKHGRNVLLLKITQYNKGWGFCARLLKPDGSRLEGLTLEPTR